MGELHSTLYKIKSGAAWITLNRPQNRNALSAELVTELYDHLSTANADEKVRSIVITGCEPAFCAGADLKSPPGQSIEGGRAVPYADVLRAILNSEKPVIAAVNGAAFAGGLGLIGASDIVIAADDATFSFSEVLIMGCGSFLPVSASVARRQWITDLFIARCPKQILLQLCNTKLMRSI
jgi:enoyl-CoA hydratase/carnithine racemase